MIVTLTYEEATRPFEIELGDGVAYEPILRYAAAYRLKLLRARPPGFTGLRVSFTDLGTKAATSTTRSCCVTTTFGRIMCRRYLNDGRTHPIVPCLLGSIGAD